MATQPVPNPAEEERPLSYEEGWELLQKLYGSLRGALAEEGGASEVLRREREAWGE